MAGTNLLPRTLQEAVLYFSDEQKCFDFVVDMRWPSGVRCIHCDCDRVGFIATRKKFKCKNKECRKQFSVKTGSVMEDSPLGLDKWILCIWMVANCKNGVSSYEIHRELGITQKSAWFLLQRVRLAMQAESLDKFEGPVEVDETFIGAKARNMHKSKKERLVKGRGASGKTIVLGALDRKKRKVRTKVIPDTSAPVLTEGVKEYVEPGSTVYTDAHKGYDALTDEDYEHLVINHSVEYVNGKTHTQGIENFWSLLKRGLHGTYVSVEPFHLFRYLDEQTFRYDYRKEDNLCRLQLVAGNIAGKRLQYKHLTGQHLRGKDNTKPA